MAMKKFCLILLPMLIFLSFPVVSAEMVTSITTDKDSYTLNEIVLINIEIVNEFKFSSDFEIEIYITYPDGTFVPGSTRYKTITLLPLESKSLSFDFFPVISMPTGDYSFHINILEDNNVLDSQTKTFSVGSSEEKEDKSVQLQITVFQDDKLKTKKFVFKKGETAYIQIIPNREGVKLDTSLKMPDGSEKVLSLSENIAVVQLDKIGTYALEVTASKQGYLTSTKQIQFAVIEKQAEIKSASMCNADGKCEGKENYQNCPQDCPSGSKDGYCDKVKDNICDPDCDTSLDVDCVKKEGKGIKSKTVLVGVTLTIFSLIFILSLIFLRWRRKRSIVNTE